MTLGEGKRRVRMLLDEYSAGGLPVEDADLGLRMTDFFDQAQRHISGYKAIVRTARPQAVEGTWGETVPCAMPPDFRRVFRVWWQGRPTRRYLWRGDTILLPRAEVGRVEVEYFADPDPIPPDAPDSYAFQVAEDAAACMPYFVAAQQLVSDLAIDHRPLLELYNLMLQSLDVRLTEGGGTGVRQRLYPEGRR